MPEFSPFTPPAVPPAATPPTAERSENPHGGESVFRLADFIRLLIKRWYVFVACVLLFLLGGIVYFQLRPTLPILHQTAIQIGMRSDSSLLEDGSVVIEKLESAFIPRVLQEHAQENGYDMERYRVQINGTEDKKSSQRNIITLQSFGSEKGTQDILAIHKRITDLLVQDHAALSESVKRSLELQKLLAELELQKIKKEQEDFSKRFSLLDQRLKLRQQQMEALQRSIEASEKDRAAAYKSLSTSGRGDATILLAINEAISKDHERLRTFEEEIQVTGDGERAALLREEADLARKEQEQARKVADIEANISAIRPTEIVLPPSRGFRKSQGTPIQVVVLIGLIGAFVGLVSVAVSDIVADAVRSARSA